MTRLAPVKARHWSREAVAARLGKMLLARVERLEELDRITRTRVDWEFSLGGITYRVSVNVCGRER